MIAIYYGYGYSRSEGQLIPTLMGTLLTSKGPYHLIGEMVRKCASREGA